MFVPQRRRTDCDGLDLDALLDVGSAGVVRLLVLEDRLAAESVDECCATCGHSLARVLAGFVDVEAYRFLRRRTPSDRTGYPS
jgi:NCAIR mutase (PurE)-related protein